MITSTENQQMCVWCGSEPATDAAHLFRRSTSPQLKEDPENIIKLGRRCHRYATENREFEQLLQEKFFLKKPIELTVLGVQETMRSGIQLSPREVVEFRRYLAGEFSYLSTEMERVKMAKPEVWNKVRPEFKSDTACDRAWEQTEMGLKEMSLKYQLKAIEKMLSSLRGMSELQNLESKFNY